MPKIKTHKGTAKVVKKRKNDIVIGKPGSRQLKKDIRRNIWA